jgi:hypothetical protein
MEFDSGLLTADSWLLTDCQVELGKLLLNFTSVVILGSESCGTQPYCTVSRLWEFGLQLVLASTVILDSESCGTRDHILVFHNSRSPATHLLTVKIKSHNDWWSVSHSWCQAPSGAQDHIFVTVRQLQFCRCGAPSLTRARVCYLPWSQSVVQVVCIYSFICWHSI